MLIPRWKLMNLSLNCLTRFGVWSLALGLMACGGGEPAAAPPETKTEPAAATPDATPAATPAPELGSMDAFAGKKFSRGLKTRKKIALTFDDGPHPKLTPQVLEVLKAEGVTATFFWLGNMAKANPETAQMVIDGGYEIGTHSWTHARLDSARSETVRKEILETQDLVEQLTGKRPRLFRPPYGAIGKTLTETCKEDNLVICMWSVDTLDWDKGRSTEKMIDVAVNQAENGAVILLHDIHPRTAANLAQIIKGLKARGFEFVTMGELVAEKAAHPEEDADEQAGGADPTMGAPAGPTIIPLNKSKAK